MTEEASGVSEAAGEVAARRKRGRPWWVGALLPIVCWRGMLATEGALCMFIGLNMIGFSPTTFERLVGAISKWVEGVISCCGRAPMGIVIEQRMKFLIPVYTIIQTRNVDIARIVIWRYR